MGKITLLVRICLIIFLLFATSNTLQASEYSNSDNFSSTTEGVCYMFFESKEIEPLDFNHSVLATFKESHYKTEEVTKSIVFAKPTINLSAIPIICKGTTSVTLSYTATSNNPNKYSVIFDQAAKNVGFSDVSKDHTFRSDAGSLNINVPTNAPFGTYEATFYTSSSSNSSDKSDPYRIKIIIGDNDNPTITTLAAINVNADSGTCTYNSTQLTKPTASDNCSVVSVIASPTSLVLGANTVTWTVTDGAGRKATSSQTVTVVDAQDPTITTLAAINVNADSGICTYASSQLTKPSAADNCSIASVIASPTSLVLGANTVTWTVTDGAGRKATSSQTVTVVDSQNPTITTLPVINVNADSGTCTYASSQLTKPSAADNCSIASVIASPTSLVLGANTVTWTVTDGAGRKATSTQTVTVVDAQDPTIATLTAIDVNADAGTCTYASSQLTKPSAADNCSVASIVATPTSLALGPNTVTWTVTDGAGRTKTSTQMITVVDAQDPTITILSAIDVNADAGTCTYASSQLTKPSAVDNCSVAIVMASPTSLNLGPNTVTWTVTDGAGRKATSSQTVTVVDSENPTITTLAPISVNADAGKCDYASTQLTKPGASDNCSVASILATPATLILGTNSVTWTVTDGAGQTATSLQTVTVVDSQNPTINCIGDQVRSSDLDECYYTVLGTEFNPTATSDNCSIQSVINDFNSSSTLEGAMVSNGTIITWSVTDSSSNITTCSFTVIVNDTQNPITPTLPDLISQCSLTVVPPTTTDNCDEVVTGTTGVDLTITESGSIFWIFTDKSGNNTTAVEQKVIISDTEAPDPDKPNLQRKTITGCQITSISDLERPTATDNCEGTIIGTLSSTFTFPYSFYGTKTINWEFIDSKGNISTQPQEIQLNQVAINGGTIKGVFQEVEFLDQIDISSCGQAVTVSLAVSGQEGTIISWEKFAVNDGSWNVISNSSNTLTATFPVGGLESTYYRALIRSGTCTEYSDSFFIRALPAGEAPTVTIVDHPNNKYCLGEEVSINAKSNYTATQPALPDNAPGDFNQGQLNTQDRDSWLVDGEIRNFTAGGNSAAAKNWSGTNDHPFGGIRYDSKEGKFAIAQGDFFEKDRKGDIIYDGKNPTTLESPITDFSDAKSATLNFDQAYNLVNNDVAIIEISFDGGEKYMDLYNLHAANTGNKNWYDAGLAESYAGSDNLNYNFNTDNTSISLAQFFDGRDVSKVRIKWTFVGTSGSSVWALDNIFINKEIFVETGIELTDGIGDPDEDPIVRGNTELPIKFTPRSPGVHSYGGTALIKGCRTYDNEGTDLIEISVSSSFAGSDIIYSAEECGRNKVQLNAYDNSKTANENIAKDSYPPDAPQDCKNCDDPGTGDIGTWTWAREGESTSCLTETLSNINDPNASFIASAGTYNLTWTVNGCASKIKVIITDCDKVDFDGEDNFVDFSDNYNLSGSFSLEMWVKPELINSNQTLFSKRDANYSGNAKGYDLSINGSGEVLFNWDKSGSISSSPYKISTNRWYHIAITHSESGEYKLYIDGIYLKLIGGGSPSTNEYNAIMGAMDTGVFNKPLNFYNGWMDEAKIWNVTLSADQIRQMMNQKIKTSPISAGKVQGDVLELDITGLSWSNLLGYYQMESIGCGYLNSSVDSIKGELKNITTAQPQTAPLPYISVNSGKWNTSATWAQPNVWDIPNSNGVGKDILDVDPNHPANYKSPIDWNIVKLTDNKNINSGGRNITLLGLLSESGKLTMDGVTDISNGTGTGQGLWITHYLFLNGIIDLEGESQLVQKRYSSTQTYESIYNETSKGYIERDQQGTARSFNYNYWSSPVVPVENKLNSTYTVKSVLLDGTISSSPKIINFGDGVDFADFALTVPRKISNRWIYKFKGKADEYSDYELIGSTGKLNVGEGYTMKGTSGESKNTDKQNYVFRGKPNNGDISLEVFENQNYMIGNPYPSALDAKKFILDNLNKNNVNGATNTDNVFNGALYFWDHFGGENNNHNLSEYVGGYATYNLIDGVKAIATDDRINSSSLNNNNSAGYKPGQYIPVGQGFFINTAIDSIRGDISGNGGTIKFKNSQRIFINEKTSTSHFLSPEKTLNNQKEATPDPKIRLDFSSPLGYHRQILVGANSNATNGYDLGYDAPLNDYNEEDFFWLINNYEYVIQGVSNFDPDQVLPIGVYISKAGEAKFEINKLENIPDNTTIYLKDLDTKLYHDLRESEFKITLEPGAYYERFQIVFEKKDDDAEEAEEETDNEEEETGDESNPDVEEEGSIDPEDLVDLDSGLDIVYMTTNRELAIINPSNLAIQKVVIYNILGQKIQEYEKIENKKMITLGVKEFPMAVYLVKMYSEKGEISKNIMLMR
ncbi:LamG-like jellyroll fold domain-containing protein [Gillisia sp. CAL575]|uniref:LamG-like jellyroll fold domain-containing protein n=1 Tax=Gillisia sp. CAL575 TaxID=985255 RepID=UPI000550D0AD|nr:LamG-like jellyroll fold domain-containing protein [Gillisia sp. CAL575]